MPSKLEAKEAIIWLNTLQEPIRNRIISNCNKFDSGRLHWKLGSLPNAVLYCCNAYHCGEGKFWSKFLVKLMNDLNKYERRLEIQSLCRIRQSKRTTRPI